MLEAGGGFYGGQSGDVVSTGYSGSGSGGSGYIASTKLKNKGMYGYICMSCLEHYLCLG